MKKLFLAPVFVCKKLDIVNKQRIHRPVKAFEVIYRVQLQRLHHVSNKALTV